MAVRITFCTFVPVAVNTANRLIKEYRRNLKFKIMARSNAGAAGRRAAAGRTAGRGRGRATSTGRGRGGRTTGGGSSSGS